MFRLKLKFEFGESWNKLKKSSSWNNIKMSLLDEVSRGLMDMISATAAAEWKRPTGSANRSWYVQVDKVRGVAIIGNTQPYLYWQNYGVISHQMRYLLNVGEKQYLAFGKYPYWGKKFIPIITDQGIIFRRCTEKSIRAGGWWHPGYKGKHFVEHGIEMYRDLELKRTYRDILIRGGVLKR